MSNSKRGSRYHSANQMLNIYINSIKDIMEASPVNNLTVDDIDNIIGNPINIDSNSNIKEYLNKVDNMKETYWSKVKMSAAIREQLLEFLSAGIEASLDKK